MNIKNQAAEYAAALFGGRTEQETSFSSWAPHKSLSSLSDKREEKGLG